ncbi:DNA cytosine methyltransferase [Amycolatopsis sp. YIM 10]|uniref:DNA cytosine methyltransferase n=1 Tax=Amycolatopsis sp. YIM 10 TaxID=2653857 RepID=UPI00128FEB4C|nr:DNA (cytosine-5-)-methyltransferase [Amycolatopsis sp. YIM 10]QFU85539.1 Modification methylase AplI [Amycolatopsis sp. YIM 10]
MSESFEAVEICAGAGGQALGLEKAGFKHTLAVELDENACTTLRANLPAKIVKQGDVADPDVWKPADYAGVSLLAGGVPCPPFSIAGKQLGANDERDLFAWTVEQACAIKPRALLLENVRGLSMPRFAGYRQHVLDRLTEAGYVAEWKLLQASGFGVPQLRPRFVLVALQEEDAEYFAWPEESKNEITVGEAIKDLMAAGGWEGADDWAKGADKIGPTIVGGSKKHGGADLGPTRAKRAWAELGVDAMGVANEPPGPGQTFPNAPGPKLTCDMVARIQGWSGEYQWEFTGRKTSRYRQIGNAFPPPVAHAVGTAIINAFERHGKKNPRKITEHDPIYKALRNSKNGYISAEELMKAGGKAIDASDLERRIALLSKDFVVQTDPESNTTRYKLGDFKAFTGQEDHDRHEYFLKHRAKIS